MSVTVVAMYDTPEKAQQVASEIVRTGITRDAINVLQADAGESAVISALTRDGLEEQEGTLYAREIGKGAAMVTVTAGDEEAEEVFEMMNRLGARDLEELAAENWQQSGEAHETVPVVEEQVSIGKRRVLRGGLRVTSVVRERPVEETVQLREEKVNVERQPVSRKLSPQEADEAFQQTSIEVTETGEEVVVNKEARVVEEVSLRKSAEEREETVHTTARRTDVKVERVEPALAQVSK